MKTTNGVQKCFSKLVPVAEKTLIQKIRYALIFFCSSPLPRLEQEERIKIYVYFLSLECERCLCV
jgi:hypothetical protein